MAIQVFEEFGSPRASFSVGGTSHDVSFIVTGVTTENGALRHFQARQPAVKQSPFGDLERKNIDANEIAPSVWRVTARYEQPSLGVGKQPPPETGSSFVSFDTSGGTFNRTQSIRTVDARTTAGGTVTNHKGAINVDVDSKTVRGVDIVIPTLSIQETFFAPGHIVNASYIKTVRNATAKTNAAPFRGFAAGELLFLGASGSKRDVVGDWEITYKWDSSENLFNQQIGDITIPFIRGWDYLWVEYEIVEDGGTIAMRPKNAYVEQVYEETNFSSLGIGN